MTTSSLIRRNLLRAAFVVGSLAASASAQSIAGNLLIDLDATDYNATDGIWPQHSLTSLQGSFAKLPVGTPKLQTIGGKTALVFDGDDDYLAGPATTSALHAAGAVYSVEYWVFQGQARPEEAVISWGGRGGPNGSHASFRYSSAAGSGAVGRWGGADMGFAAPNAGGPEMGKWHHIVLAYDGTTQRLYVDGQLNASEAAALDARDGTLIYIGTERNGADGTDSGRTRQYSGAISKIRIHSGVLSAAQVLENYNAEAPQHPGITAAALAHPPIHRWSFNEAAGTAPEGTFVRDSIGGLTAVVRGQGATFTGSQISLPGGLPATQPAYVDLPNGLISAREHLSLEFWVTQATTQAGSRVVSFGNSDVGEINAAGNATSFGGNDYLSLYANVNSTTSMRLERNGGTVPNGLAYRQSDGATTLNTQVHYAIVYDPQQQEWRIYRNGFLMETLPELQGPTTIEDVNNWLGRSEFAVDSGFAGSFDEFRIYNYMLTESEIRGNTIAGPDTLTTAPATSSLWSPTADGVFAFNNAANWLPGGSYPDGNGAIANLVSNLTGDQTVELNTTVTAGSLTLGDPDGSNKFKLTAGTGGVLEFASAAGINATLTQAAASAANEISAPVRLLSDTEVANTSSTAVLTFSGSLQGTGAFVKAGSGEVDLTGDNASFDGSFNIHGGVLSVGNGGTSGSLGDSPVSLTEEGILALNRSDASTLNSSITGSGLIRVQGTGQVTNAGAINTTGTLAVSPAADLTNTGSIITSFANVEGRLTSKPAATLVTGDLNIGNLEAGPSTLLLEDGTVDAAAIYVAKNAGTSGVILQTGGILNDRTGGGDCVIGGVAGTANQVWGAYRLTGGVLNTTSHFQIGGQGTGVMEVENAIVNFNGGYPSIARYVNGTTSRGRGVMDVRNGGVVNQNATGTRLMVGEKGNGTLNVRDGGLVDLDGGLLMISTATDQGQSDVNLLPGGTIATPLVLQNSTQGLEQGRFNFHGGVLKAKASAGNFMQNIDRAYIYPGGAIIDSNGFDIGISQNFDDPTGQGVASIPVTSGGSGYLAPPYLEITGDGTGATAMATLANGQITGIVITNPGTGYSSAPTVNIIGGGTGSGLTLGTPVLADNHAGTFTKTGAGSLALYSSGSFTGNAAVEAGKLLVNGSFGAPGKQISVAAGATLGGFGQVGGDVVVDGSINAGTADATSLSDLLTIAGNVSFHSGSKLEVDISEGSFQPADCLEVGGQLDISGATLQVNLLSPPTELPLTIARSNQRVGTFAAVPAGVAVKYNATSVEITAITITDPYQSWISGFFPGSTDQAVIGKDADPDGDGFSNALEFALGGTPAKSSDAPKTHAATADSGDADSLRELVLTIAVPVATPAFSTGTSPSASIGGFTLTVEGSPDLGGFLSPVSQVAPLTTGLPTAPDGYEYRSFRLDASNGLTGKGFLRVKVTETH